MVAVPLQTKDLVKSLGSSAEVISSQVSQLNEGSLDKLKKLRSAYTVPTAALTRYQAAADRSSDLPPFGFNPNPRDALSSLTNSVGATYFQAQVEPHDTAGDPFPALLDRFSKRGQILAMAIHQRNELRMAVEKIAVGRVRPDGRNDATITIETGKRAKEAAIVGSRIEQMASRMPPELVKQFLELYQAQQSFGAFGVFSNGLSLDSSSLDGSSDEYGEEGSFSSPNSSVGTYDQTGGLDTEILNLKRMIDKKSQATDLYSQTLTAYNNAAKNIIEKMRA